MPDKLTARTLAMLAARDISASLDEDGDVIFKHKEKTWLMFVDPVDDTFFRLVLPNFWPIESDEEHLRVLEACSRATASTKVAKVYIVKKNVWASAEMFVPPEQWDSVLDRSVDVILVAVQAFRAAVR